MQNKQTARFKLLYIYFLGSMSLSACFGSDNKPQDQRSSVMKQWIKKVYRWIETKMPKTSTKLKNYAAKWHGSLSSGAKLLLKRVLYLLMTVWTIHDLVKYLTSVIDSVTEQEPQTSLGSPLSKTKRWMLLLAVLGLAMVLFSLLLKHKKRKKRA